MEYFFAWGFNSTTLYFLSFILPNYVESQINKEYATTILGWISFSILAIIFAPIIEELFFRGIILQKLATQRNIQQGLLISAIIFAIIHFRYDIITLSWGGIILAILYLKTNQLIIPIIYHFVYNLMSVIGLFYYHFLAKSDNTNCINIANCQQNFIDNLGLVILFISLSAPYLIYFVYKNFPRNYNINKLPYFANKQSA